MADRDPATLHRAAIAVLDGPAHSAALAAAASGGVIDPCPEEDPAALMVALLGVAAAYAVVPISGFRVGAVAASPSPSGDGWALYLGANHEFAGHALAHSIHAEQSAVNTAWLHGAGTVAGLAVTAAPCGHCRQFLTELEGADDLELVVAGTEHRRRLTELLPDAFGPDALGVTTRLMGDVSVPGGSVPDDELAAQAVRAARRSHAPYSGNRAGVALQLVTGGVIVGRSAETAAFNPGLTALQSAASRLALAYPPGVPRPIARAVLAESGGAASQASISADLLAAMAPGITLEVVTA